MNQHKLSDCWNGPDKLSHAEKSIQRLKTKRQTSWPIASTGKSTKLDKRATFPKPFPYYSIALQQMHKMISCKARTMKHRTVRSGIKTSIHRTMVPVKEETLRKEN